MERTDSLFFKRLSNMERTEILLTAACDQYRLKMAKEESSFGGDERTEDDRDDISMLYEQIDED